MTEKQMAILSKAIKYTVMCVFLVLVILVITQYIKMATLSAQQNTLSTELEQLEEQKSNEEARQENLEDNYSQFVEDYAKEYLNMVKDGEVRFSA